MPEGDTVVLDDNDDDSSGPFSSARGGGQYGVGEVVDAEFTDIK